MDAHVLTLAPLSKIEGLHNSQKLFGFFCYQVLDRYNSETLERILSQVAQDEKVLNISSLLPENSVFWPSFQITYSGSEIFDSVIAKQIKKLKYVSESVLKELLQASHMGDLIVENIRSGNWVFNQDLLMQPEEVAYAYNLGIDIRFSSKLKTPFPLKAYGIKRMSRFVFYLETDIEEIEAIIEDLSTVHLGKYKTASLNTYTVVKRARRALTPTRRNVLLSKYIPKTNEEFDHNTSLVNIEMAGSKMENRMHQPYDARHIDHFPVIAEGSIIVTDAQNPGRLKIRENASKISGKTIYYNGKAMLYPVGDNRA